MGAAFSTTALVLALGFGKHTAADVVLVLLAVAAGLESIFAVCLGCQVFAVLMRIGVIPETVCAECADISLRLRSAER
jgi:anthranilate/para-aminobenzoate synthase component II